MKEYQKEDFEQFYNLIGLDQDNLKYTIRHFEDDGMELGNLMDMYNISNARYVLPDSSKEIAEYYTILNEMLNDEFWIENSKNRRRAKKDALTLLENTSCLTVIEEDNFDAKKNFLRVNEILRTMLLGLCSVENPSGIDWITKTTSPVELLNRKILTEENKRIRMMYELILLSKLPDTEVDHLIFNENNEIDEAKLLIVLKYKISNDEQKERTTKNNFNQKTLRFRRPTLNELKNIE